MATQLKTNINWENINDLKNYFDRLLESEWLWDIDSIEWFKEVIQDTSIKTLNILDKEKYIKELEETHQVNFEINNEESEVILKNPIWQVIWYFRPRYYSHWKVEIFKHIERHVDEEYRWKWLAKALNKVWEISNFPILDKEVSHKPSNMLFLMSIWYEITGYYDDNSEIIELTQGQIIQLEKQLTSLVKSWDKELDFSYSFEKNSVKKYIDDLEIEE